MKNKRYLIYICGDGGKEELDTAETSEEAENLKKKYLEILGQNYKIMVRSF